MGRPEADSSPYESVQPQQHHYEQTQANPTQPAPYPPQANPTQPAPYPPPGQQIFQNQPAQFPPQNPMKPAAYPPQGPHPFPNQPAQFPPQSPQMNPMYTTGPNQPANFPPQAPQQMPQAFPPQAAQNPCQAAQAQSQGRQFHPKTQVNGIPMQPVNQQQQAWTTGIFDCLEDPSNALITALFPCVTFGQVAEIVDNGQTTCGTNGVIYGLVAGTGMPCLVSCGYRFKLRAKYGLIEDPAPDWLIHWLFEPCALCQEYRELNNRGLDPSIGTAFLTLDFLEALFFPINRVLICCCFCRMGGKYIEAEYAAGSSWYGASDEPKNDALMNAIRGQVLLMNPLPSVQQAYSFVSQEEKQCLLSSSRTTNDSVSSAAMAVQGNPRPNSSTRRFNHGRNERGRFERTHKFNGGLPDQFNGGRQFEQERCRFGPRQGRPHCSHCGEHGHWIHTCYELHGYPVGHPKANPGMRGRSAANHVSNGVSKEDGNSVVGISESQLQQLLSLLKVKDAEPIPQAHSVTKPVLPRIASRNWIIDSSATDHISSSSQLFFKK